MNIKIIAASVPAIIVVFGCLGIAAQAGFGWPLTILGAVLFVGSMLL